MHRVRKNILEIIKYNKTFITKHLSKAIMNSEMISYKLQVASYEL